MAATRTVSKHPANELLRLMRHERHILEALFDAALATRPHGIAGRRWRVAELRRKLETLARAEESALYPTLLAAPATERLAQEGREEHEAIRSQLDELEALSPDSPEWETKLLELKETVAFHLEDEETMTLQRMLTALGPRELAFVASRFAAHEEITPRAETLARSA